MPRSKLKIDLKKVNREIRRVKTAVQLLKKKAPLADRKRIDLKIEQVDMLHAPAKAACRSPRGVFTFKPPGLEIKRGRSPRPR